MREHDRIIKEADKEELEIIQTTELEKDFFPLMTYDAVSHGYPVPIPSCIVARAYGGTNSKGELISGRGEFCKVDDVKKLINTYKEMLKSR